MRDLATIQRDVAAAILGEAPVDEGLARYREQFFLRHVAVLEEDFAQVLRAMSHDAFHDLARRYLAAHPPHLVHAARPSVATSRRSSRIPCFATSRASRGRMSRRSTGPNAPPLDPASLAGVAEEAWPSARIVLMPSLQRLALDHPSRRHVVVFRGRETEIAPSAFALLDAIAGGATLEEACERIAPPREEIAGWFRAWTEAGWISRIYFPASLAPASALTGLRVEVERVVRARLEALRARGELDLLDDVDDALAYGRLVDVRLHRVDRGVDDGALRIDLPRTSRSPSMPGCVA